ncbi:hypothetical protein Tco_0868968 [Tanacetum coccineum]
MREKAWAVHQTVDGNSRMNIFDQLVYGSALVGLTRGGTGVASLGINVKGAIGRMSTMLRRRGLGRGYAAALKYC